MIIYISYMKLDKCGATAIGVRKRWFRVHMRSLAGAVDACGDPWAVAAAHSLVTLCSSLNESTEADAGRHCHDQQLRRRM